MFGESCGRSGKSKQDLNRGTEIFERTLLPEGLAQLACGHVRLCVCVRMCVLADGVFMTFMM